MRLLTTALICLFAAPAVAAKVHVVNDDASCTGKISIQIFDSDDNVRMIPVMTKDVPRGSKAKLKCNSNKRCYVSWNDQKGGSWHGSMVSAKKTSKKKPFVLKCTD